MPLRRAALYALVATLAAPQAFAQDELFVPLSPQEDSKPKPKPGKRRTKKSAGKPAGKSAGKSARKPSTAKKVQPPLPSEDELFLPIAPVRPQLLVKLSGDIKGARLFVDNRPVGTLPLSAPIEVEAGARTVLVRRPGFADFSRRVTVEPGKTHELAVTLEAVAGVVAVSADVPGASVAIDGVPQGQAPLTGLLLKPGPHEIVITSEGFEPNVKSLDVRAGRDYNVTANMRPAVGERPVVAGVDRPEKPVLTPPDQSLSAAPVAPVTPGGPEVSGSQPWFKRWYVWAGVGAAVTAAAVGTVVATQGSSGPALTPRDVCGGDCDGTINGIVRF